MNDSSTGGFLLPFDPAPLADQALTVALQNIVAGTTGMPGALIRVMWQSIPVKQPEYDVDWAAIGVTVIDSDTNDTQVFNNPTISNLPAPVGELALGVGAAGGGSPIGNSYQLNGFMQAVENERMNVVVSFFGPNATGNARLLRAGIKMGQNREPLFFIHAGLMSIGTLRWVPEFVNQQWIPRMDFDFILSRTITRLYAIDPIVSAEGALFGNSPGGDPVITSKFDTASLGRG